MHAHLQLPADATQRQLCMARLKDKYLDATLRFLERKSAGLDAERPHFYMDRHEEFGNWNTFAFEVEKFDGLTLAMASATMRNMYIRRRDHDVGVRLLQVRFLGLTLLVLLVVSRSQSVGPGRERFARR